MTAEVIALKPRRKAQAQAFDWQRYTPSTLLGVAAAELQAQRSADAVARRRTLRVLPPKEQ
jgi:hypothetical protein